MWIASAGIQSARAQAGGSPGGPADAPMAFEHMPEQAPPPQPGPVMRVFQSICWYLPNRIMDITDIPRFYITMGDGMGISVRATKWLCASWYHDDVRCLGWTKRQPPWFDEKIEESYFGFIVAQEGEISRDPTEFGLSLHFILIGANIALSAGETLDALAGFVGVDLMGDDHGPVMFDLKKEDPNEKALREAVYGPQNPPPRTDQPPFHPPQQMLPAPGTTPNAPLPPPVTAPAPRY